MSRLLLLGLASLLWLLQRLPITWLMKLGDALGKLLYFFARNRRAVGACNIRHCWPNLTVHQQQQLLHRHFCHMGRALLAYAHCWYASAAQLKQLVQIEGEQHLRACADRPVILFMAHFTGLEIAGMRLALETPLATVYARQKYPYLDRFIRAKRTRFPGSLVFARQQGIRMALRALRDGVRLYYLPDQDCGLKSAVFTPFLGQMAATTNGLSRLAKITKAVVLPCFVRCHDTGYVLRIEAPLSHFPSDDATADTQHMNAHIETWVKEAPEQYFWLHKRFKTTRNGTPNIYHGEGLC